MDETARMQWEEIRRAWPDEYVLLDDLLIDHESNTLRAGRVLAHAPQRKAAFASAGTLAGRSWALRWTGRVHVPEGWVGLLVGR